MYEAMKIKFTMYGKSFEEEVQDIVIYDETGQSRLLAFTTHDQGICITTPGGKEIFISGEGYKI